MVIQDDDLDSGFFKRFNSLAVFRVLSSSDQKDIWMETEDFLGIENIVVVTADTRQIFHLRKRLRKNLIFTVARIFPSVFCQSNDFFKAGRTAHHHKVRDVVSDDKGLRLILEMNFPTLDIRNIKGHREHGTAKGRKRRKRKSKNQLSQHCDPLRLWVVAFVTARKSETQQIDLSRLTFTSCQKPLFEEARFNSALFRNLSYLKGITFFLNYHIHDPHAVS